MSRITAKIATPHACLYSYRSCMPRDTLPPSPNPAWPAGHRPAFRSIIAGYVFPRHGEAANRRSVSVDERPRQRIRPDGGRPLRADRFWTASYRESPGVIPGDPCPSVL